MTTRRKGDRFAELPPGGAPIHDQMLTSVVIPCYDGADDTRACLTALAASVDAGAVEVIVVDNGSRDPAALVAATRAGVNVEVVHLPENLGFAGGVNRGLARARGEVLVVLNNDTLPAPHMLARLHRARHSQPAPAMVAPVSNYVKGSATLPVGHRGSTPEGLAELDAELDASCGGVVQDVDALAGLCLMFSRDLWRDVGGFDEGFGLGNFEDDDLSLRVRLAGGRLLVARDAFLHHWGSRTFTALGVDYAAQLARNGDLMDAKWQHEPAWQALTAALAGDAVRAGACAAHALVAHPHWPDGHLFLAGAAHLQGDHTAAATYAERFLRACPANWQGHVTFTVALLGAGRLQAAARAVQTALGHCYVEAEPAARLVTQLAHGLNARGELTAAREAAAAALQIAPNGERSCLLGALHAAGGDLAAAARAFATGAEQGHPEARVRLGLCQWQQGEHASALRSLTHAVVTAPSDARARQALTTALAACKAAGVEVGAAERALAVAGRAEAALAGNESAPSRARQTTAPL